MELKIHKPLSPLLQRHIECFYTLNRQAEQASETYLTFPSIYNIVCLYSDTVTQTSGNLLSIDYEPNGILESRVVGKFSKAVCVKYQGQISEITTLFKPLAINAFLPSPLKDYTSGHFSLFNPYPDFLPTMQGIQRKQDTKDKLAELEAYWLTKYHGFTHPFLPAIVDEMNDEGTSGRSIAAMSMCHGISRQTLHQHFERYLCKTPAEFRKIVRFRKALHSGNLLLSEPRLTRISLLANYFDQSHMIRDFKELTGHTPKSFFRSITRFGDGEVNWLFL